MINFLMKGKFVGEKIMNTKKYLITTIILWIIVILLMINPVKESIYSYQNGVNVALEGIEMIYGIEAISFILSLYTAFYFPLFIIWVLLLIATILLTIVTIIKYKKKV